MAGPSYIALDSEVVPLDRAVPLTDNPHHGDVVAVARSFARFGQRKQIVLRRIDDYIGEIEAGNTSYAAVQLLHDMAGRLQAAEGKPRVWQRTVNDVRAQLGEEATDALLATVDELGESAWSQIHVTWVEEEAEEGLAFAATDNHTARLGHDDPEAMRRLTERVAATEAALVHLFTLAPDPLPTAGDPPPEPPGPSAAPSGSAGAAGLSRDPLEASAQRTLAFTMSMGDYHWTAAHIGNLRRDWDLPDDTQVILRLISDAVGATPPGLVASPAGEDDL